NETPLHLLMRLFLARVRVAETALREAIAPMALEKWEKVGLVKLENGFVIPRLKLVPFDRFYLAQEIFDPTSRMPGDYVTGVGPATLMVSNFMIRRRTRLSLDLGTGCGLLALLKSGESDRVIATDQNARAVRMAQFNARINRFSNVECREGDMFQPV